MKNKSKKTAVVFVILLSVLVGISGILYLILELASSSEQPSTSGKVFLYKADFDAEIMTEENYLILDRSIKYSDGVGTWAIADDKNTYATDDVQLFLIEYIRALVAGDAEKLKGMYSENVVKELNIPDRITQQRVYHTVFTEISMTTVDDSDEKFFRYEIKAEYKIMKNDGTFRMDLASDAIKAQYFVIDLKKDSCEIIQVVEYVADN